MKSYIRKSSTVALFFLFAFSSVSMAQEHLEEVRTSQGETVLVQSDSLTGTARHVLGIGANTRDYGIAEVKQASVPALSAALFRDYAQALKVNPDALKLKKAKTDAGMWFVTYAQTVGGVPVYGTEIGYTVNERGDVGAFASRSVLMRTPMRKLQRRLACLNPAL